MCDINSKYGTHTDVPIADVVKVAGMTIPPPWCFDTWLHLPQFPASAEIQSAHVFVPRTLVEEKCVWGFGPRAPASKDMFFKALKPLSFIRNDLR